MIGDYHVRFCEGLGVKVSRSTWRAARGKPRVYHRTLRKRCYSGAYRAKFRKICALALSRALSQDVGNGRSLIGGGT
jgi:hypothetical protein